MTPMRLDSFMSLHHTHPTPHETHENSRVVRVTEDTARTRRDADRARNGGPLTKRGAGCEALLDFDDHGGDVVFAAALVGELDEFFDGDFGAELHDRGDVALFQVAVEAVAAQKEAVAFF